MTGDGDIHFPPGQRREKPAFEPPPWEREQFEQLAKQRQDVEVPEQTVGGVAPEAVAVPEPVPTPQPADNVEAGEERVDALDPKHVEMLLMELRAEEPRPDEAYWKVSSAAGVTSAFIGIVVTTWGVIALMTPKQQGGATVMMVLLLLFFGLGFMAGGVWVVINTLRKRGVL